jgi:hypothetical protein
MNLNTENELELVEKIKSHLMPLYKKWNKYYKNALNTSTSSAS